MHLYASLHLGSGWQDWTWSTGCHPFSSTGWGSELSQLHRDALARSYIVTALDESIAVVNEAIEILAKEQTRMSPAFFNRYYNMSDSA